MSYLYWQMKIDCPGLYVYFMQYYVSSWYFAAFVFLTTAMSRTDELGLHLNCITTKRGIFPSSILVVAEVIQSIDDIRRP